MKIPDYGVYSDFDLQKHTEKFVNYLEVIIDREGRVYYAVPSHTEKAAELACSALGVTRAELNELCPPEWQFDYLQWLLRQTGSIAIWFRGLMLGEGLSKAQLQTLRKLKFAGAYSGPVPGVDMMIKKEKLSDENDVKVGAE